MHSIVNNNKKAVFSMEDWHLANCENEIYKSHKSEQPWLLHTVYNKLGLLSHSFGFMVGHTQDWQRTWFFGYRRVKCKHAYFNIFVCINVSYSTNRIWKGILITQTAAIRNGKAVCLSHCNTVHETTLKET